MSASNRIPRIASIETAVRMYYSKYELSRSDIMELFGCGGTKAGELKRAAVAYQREQGVMLRVNSAVCTDLAYKAWGLDIDALEKRFQKAEKLGIATCG